MHEVEFEWNEKQLNLLADSVRRWNPHEQPLKLGNISLEAKFGEFSHKNDLLDHEIAKLLNTKFDQLMDYDEQKRKTDENWVDQWARISEKLSISHIDETKGSIVFRRLKIFPNLGPVLAIAHTGPKNVIIVYGKEKEDVDLRTVLRHSYSNIPTGSLQTVYFLTKNLLDLYSQLFTNQVSPQFKTKHLRCLPSMWLQYDLFGPILDVLGGQESDCPIPLDEATANWVHRRWDNYEYLMYLNGLAGRVRGEVHNHPIVPWVCDFSGKHGGFRPLNRTKYRLCKGDDQLREMYSREPSHHVPELLSDIGYMVYRARVEPKTTLCHHVRQKWVPEEYPSTMSRMFEFTPDECIPEFYDDPSIFKSCHADMPDLKHPDFVDSPEEFVRWHRGMLEDEEVSKNLHRWIDLVFGFNLSIEDSKNALNLHLCFVEKNRRGLRTNGMVQLFDRPHPTRLPLNYNPKLDMYHLQMESFGYGMNNPNEEEIVSEADDENSHYQLYQKIKVARRLRYKIYFESMVSLMEVMAQIVLAPNLCGRFDDPVHIRRCIKQYAYRIPVNYRKLFDFLTNSRQDFPDPDEFAFFATARLNIPTDISNFAEEFSKCVSFHLLRKLVVVPPFSKRSQLILLKEVESLKKSIRLCHHLEFCVVAAFQQLLEDEEACIQSVHRLMPTLTRSLSQPALETLINPMIELIQCETSIKLLDRRFLMHVSICYGTRAFLDLFLPPIVEACASLNADRSVVAKESIMWLAKRYGPVICAKFISSNLLRIMASCYDRFEMSEGHDGEPTAVFDVSLRGDDTCSRIESLLSEIVLTYSATFITVQFLPFCVDLIEQFHKRPSVHLEPGLVSVFRIVELSIRSMSDHQLMNYLEEFIIQKVIYRVLTIMLDVSFQFSTERVRNIIICKVCQLLHNITQKIGTENTRIYASQPFNLLFSTFAGVYETNEELRINLKKRSADNTLYEVPLWIVEDVIDKFAREWGVPYLSSFCDEPAFLIPFVSNSTASPSPNMAIPSANSPPMSFYSLGSMSSGNRLFSLSASSPVNSVNNTLGGMSLCDSGALSAVWCARVSAAVCGVDNYRFDHLSLCNFTGHQERIRKLAAISNENSFVSASSDKTVKLWSIKPELDEIGCQWTYQNHTRSVCDVTILADNSIASTDGSLHVWDPFRTTLLAQLEWDSKEGANISRVENVDRHILAAICSLHSTVKLFDSRVGGWTCELKVSPGQGLARALTVRDNGNKMAVAMSNGTLAILDARNGKINALAQTNSTHTVSVNWLNDTRLLVCDADEPGVFLETSPRAHIVRKLQDPVSAAVITDASIVTLQTANMLRVYQKSGELQIETKIRPDELPGTPSAVLPLPLNCSYLIGSTHGAIRLMC